MKIAPVAEVKARFSAYLRVLQNSGYGVMMAILGAISSGHICLISQAQTLQPSHWAFWFPSAAFCR